MQRKQFSNDLRKSNPELVHKFLSDEFVDNNLIYLLCAYCNRDSSHFEYLAREFANILSNGINAGTERENKAWHAIESIISSLKYNNDERTYFIMTWQSFSILIPDFKNFDRHCLAVQEAYFRFEKYFGLVRHELHTKDFWYTDITDYNWWLKVDEFYKSRHKE